MENAGGMLRVMMNSYHGHEQPVNFIINKTLCFELHSSSQLLASLMWLAIALSLFL